MSEFRHVAGLNLNVRAKAVVDEWMGDDYEVIQQWNAGDETFHLVLFQENMVVCLRVWFSSGKANWVLSQDACRLISLGQVKE